MGFVLEIIFLPTTTAPTTTTTTTTIVGYVALLKVVWFSKQLQRMVNRPAQCVVMCVINRISSSYFFLLLPWQLLPILQTNTNMVLSTPITSIRYCHCYLLPPLLAVVGI